MQKTILHLNNISKSYDDGFTAVHNFDLEIKKGEFVTLLGPSGCGKTTVLKMIAGFEQPTNGKILYNGIDIKDMSIRMRPTSTVFQDYALFPNMTVAQNIKYGIKLMRKPKENVDPKIYEAAERVYQLAKKKSQTKIKEIELKKANLYNDIKKLERFYESNAYLSEIKTMRKNQYAAYLDELKTKKNDLITQSNLENKDFLIKEVDKEISLLKTNYEKKVRVDKKYDRLTFKYNDLDYWNSYWQIYPSNKKEEFENKNITRLLTKAEINEKARQIIELVGLTEKVNNFPNELSGGMQQRVALARSIVIEPEIILLDEPLSALDAKVRQQLQNELKKLHETLGITFILVTHDQEEALSLSDKVVVMSNGQIEQIGTPSEVYDSPNSLWTANFVGRANIFNGYYKTKGEVVFDDISSTTDVVEGFEENEEVYIMIRPEDFDVVPKDQGSINATVESVLYKGLMWDIKCKYQDMIINVEDINSSAVGDVVGLDWDDIDVHVIKKGVNDETTITK
ncbi:ABC transporter ATP-binding protein [Ureaplasma zalophigenitalium]|uniref:ATP-binding cassette domain-containing protein n=1 Tax=Ureaplasma zalophigenitalium TaxID=907723 RepID=A0ABT3BNI5_9BACT|nr:ATP-binding cassette domain-containing protein [Ureaplasma zalophigenitalium]MCV3753781.1 ATP-binding cassette domain-containing protein [Ureaplasma zalophigenitalium]